MSVPADREAHARPACASLTVGPVETEYLRVGNGPVVVVLDPRLAARVRDGATPDGWAAHRLIVPMRTTIEALVLPDEGRGTVFDAWFRGLLDGLGLAAVTVLAAPAIAREVERFAGAHPGDVACVVVTQDREDAWGSPSAPAAVDSPA